MPNEFKYPRAIIASPDIYPDSFKKLKSMGIEVLFSCKNENVSKPLYYHADMQIVPVSCDTFIVAPECYNYYKNLLENYNIKLIKGNTYLSCNYPLDIAYNIIVTEKYAIHNFNHTDSVLKSKLDTKKFINISQGYTACTLCALSDSAYITSDEGTSKKLSSFDFDILVINDKDIILPGFNHGFFGGSSVMLNSGLLAVNGNVCLHTDYDKINIFCQNHGVSLLSLSDNSIMDIGSLIPVW